MVKALLHAEQEFYYNKQGNKDFSTKQSNVAPSQSASLSPQIKNNDLSDMSTVWSTLTISILLSFCVLMSPFVILRYAVYKQPFSTGHAIGISLCVWVFFHFSFTFVNSSGYMIAPMSLLGGLILIRKNKNEPPPEASVEKTERRKITIPRISLRLNQNIILTTVLSVIVLMFLFPPFSRHTRKGVIINEGYRFVFDPPNHYSQVNYQLLLTQWIGVGLIAGVLYLLSKKKKPEGVKDS